MPLAEQPFPHEYSLGVPRTLASRPEKMRSEKDAVKTQGVTAQT